MKMKEGIYRSLTIHDCQNGTYVGWIKLDGWQEVDRSCVLLTAEGISEEKPIPKKYIGMTVEKAMKAMKGMEKLFS